MSKGGEARYRGRSLSRVRVVAEAIAVIDADGLKAFTLAALARRLQVQTMALYSYISSRDELLDAIVETVLVEVRTDGDLDGAGQGQWQGFLTRSAWEIRRVALAHPQVFPLVATRPPQAPWVRPPLRSLPWMEDFVRTLRGFGFTPAATVMTYRAFASFLLGHLLLEVMALGVDPAPVGHDQPGEPDVAYDHALYPVLADMEQQMRADLAAEVFNEALTDLFTRLQILL